MAAWTIRSGRQLRLGPDWAESADRLAFDDCSGDYWVLDALGHGIVRHLLAREGHLSPAHASPPSATTPLTADLLAAALSELYDAGVVQPAALPTSE